ncbi:S-adenosyl-L-methionine-dependent methyltransferase [Piedraia hortae CBS 480.64]|uniref:S-adenosyl-L-methionine-dependent methyltransferase n=1 Tax=Piedraia hortae CBS 480.64 TaxID=1314780 RepID=A0A6A7C3K2_9PEZI|nr:S-adenosyl-L-methionine-dependent methyltransferase [Piedraia hortae CBS 480.64]
MESGGIPSLTTSPTMSFQREASPTSQIRSWQVRWEENKTPWDRNAPNPALADTLNEYSSLFGGPTQPGIQARKKALVPGCGRGYDVMLLASYGYDAYGLDIAPQAIQEANTVLQAANFESKYPVHGPGRGEMKFIQGNFFSDDFLAETGTKTFDIIYDYTFLCALPKEWRPRWAKRYSELLAPKGYLVCLEFPLYKGANEPGPPFGLSPQLYEQALGRPGKGIEYDDEGDGSARPFEGERSKDGLIRVARWKAKRTHEVGKGSDHVSIWTHQT